MHPTLAPRGLAALLPLVLSLAGCTGDGSDPAPALPPAPLTPVLATITPNFGPGGGGTTVTIAGADFQSGATVTIGATAATGVSVVSATQLTCISPAGGGIVAVTVTNPGGLSATISQGFNYADATGAFPAPYLGGASPTVGPSTGGQVVTLTGQGFLSGATVDFGGNTAVGVVVASSGTCLCTTPIHATGTVAITLTNPDGQSSALGSAYTYNTTPILTAVTPTQGDVAGGTPVTLTGIGFTSGSTVQFGWAAAPGAIVVSSTTIHVPAPVGSGGPGTVTVQVNTPGGNAPLANAFTFTSGGTLPAVSGVSPVSGPASGGTVVTLTGSGFAAGATVAIGGAPATLLGAPTASQLVVTTAAEPLAANAGPLAVTVTNPGGLSAANTSPGFTYLPMPAESLSDSAWTPDLAVDGAGTLHAVWVRLPASGGATIVAARSTDGGATWSSPATLSSASTTVSGPRVTARGSTVVAVWNAAVSGTEGVDHAVSTDGGQTWSSASGVVSTGTQVADPDVALDAAGAVVVAYRAAIGAGVIHVQVVRGAVGGSFGSAATAIGGVNTSADAPALAADGATARVVVVSTAAVSGQRDPWVAVSGDGGASFAAMVRVTNSVNDDERVATIACGHGAVIVAFRTMRWGSQFPYYTMEAASSLDGGATFGAVTPLTGGSSAAQGAPDAVFAPDGTCALAWSAMAPIGGGWWSPEAEGCRTTDGGRTFTAVGRFSTGTLGNTAGTRVAVAPDGRFHHIWVDDTAVAANFDLFVR